MDEREDRREEKTEKAPPEEKKEKKQADERPRDESMRMWEALNRDAASRTTFSEYEQEKLRQKRALKELLEEYAMFLGSDPAFEDILKNVRKYVDMDANAQHKSAYQLEQKTCLQLAGALKKMKPVLEDRMNQAQEKLEALWAREGDRDEAFDKEQARLMADQEAAENRLMICDSLNAYFTGLTSGNLEVPDPQGENTVVFSMGDPSRSRNTEKYGQEGTVYMIDTTGVRVLGGYRDGARGLDGGERVDIRDEDARDLPLFPHEPNVNDIAQGSLGDCWFVNVIANVARLHPEMIRDMLKDNGDGTVTVRLYGQPSYGSQELKPVYVRVDKVIPREKGLFGSTHGADNCLWVNMIERAATAIGMNPDYQCRILPPDIFQKQDQLEKKGGEASREVKEAYPWLFTGRDEERSGLFQKWEPSYEEITGGYGRYAINMLMGPAYRSATQDVSRSKFGLELNSRKKMEDTVRNPGALTEMVMHGMRLELGGNRDDDYFALALSRSDAKMRNEYKKYENIDIDTTLLTQWEENGQEKLMLPFAYVWCLDSQDLNSRVREDFFSENNEEAVKNIFDGKLEEAKELMQRAPDGLIEDSRFRMNQPYKALILGQMAGKMKELLARSRKNHPYTVEGNQAMMREAAQALQELSPKDLAPERNLQPQKDPEKAPGKNDEKSMKQVRDEDFVNEKPYLLFDNYVDCYIRAMRKVMVSSLEKVSGLQERVNRNCEDKVGTVFRKIQKAVGHHIVITGEINAKSSKTRNDGKHLPDRHAYSIVGARQDPDGQRWVTMRNPWGDYDGNGILYDAKGEPYLGHARDGIFDLKFEDFFGQVDDISYNDCLDRLPDRPEPRKEAEKAPEQSPKKDRDFLSESGGHSFRRLLADTYYDLLKTKKWPYGSTGREFGEMAGQLKQAYLSIRMIEGREGREMADPDGNRYRMTIRTVMEGLKEKLTAYKTHCGARPLDVQKRRYGIMDRLMEAVNRSLEGETVTDPRAPGFRDLADRMLEGYYKEKKATPSARTREEDRERLLASPTFRGLVDDRNYFHLGKIGSSEAGKMLKSILKVQKTAAPAPEKKEAPAPTAGK